MSIETTDSDPDLPDVDERLVAPGSGYEIIDGRVVMVPPAHPPHATRQSNIAALFEAYTRDEYDVATEMLTRTSKIDDIAPDVSVFARAPHPRTGGRQLEELVVEIISTQSVGNAATKAAKLSARGVRRVFGIDLGRNRLLEWSRDLGTWSILDASVDLIDPVFVAPLPFAALLDAGRIDDFVARGLLARNNPVLAAEIERARREENAAAILAVLGARGLPVSEAQRNQVLQEPDLKRLARWHTAAVTCADVATLLED